MQKTFTLLLWCLVPLLASPAYAQPGAAQPGVAQPSAAQAQTVAPPLPEPVVWLRADRGAVNAALWTDESGNSHNATNPGTIPVEVAGYLNYNPVVKFSREGSTFELPYSLEELVNLTIVAVYYPEDTVERSLLTATNAGKRNVSLTTRSVSGPEEAVDTYFTGHTLPVITVITQNWPENGEEEAGNASASASLTLGKALTQGTKSFKGAVTELLIFDYALNFMERRQIETYLSIKYGLPAKEGNYVSANQQVLWNWTEDGSFGHRLAGLGRSRRLNLNQKQATSAYDTSQFLVMSLGALARTNEENKANIPEETFWVWGDNGGKLALESSPDSLMSMLGRRWIIRCTGKTATVPSQLIMDWSQLPTDTAGYWLAVDRSGGTEFSVDAMEFLEPDSITQKGLAYFNAIKWDKDGSGRDAFTIVRKQQMFMALRSLKNPDCTNQFSGEALIGVVGGTPPYSYQLVSTQGDVNRSWSGQDTTWQKRLVHGTYSLTVSDKSGLRFARQFDLTLPEPLAVDLGPDLGIEEGEYYEFDASEHIADSVEVSYRWEGSYGFSSESPQIVASEPGVYRVTVTNRLGCTFTDEVVIGGSSETRHAVYPTLATGGRFNTSVSLPEAATVSMQVYDLSGNLYF